MAVTGKGSVPFFLPHAACWEAGAPAVGAQADHRPLRAHMGSSSPLVRAALLGNIIIVSPRSSLCHWLLCWAGISRVSPSPKLASRPQHCPSHRCLCPVLLASLPIVLPTSCLQHCPLHPCLALLASLLAAMPTPCPYLALLASLPTAVPTPVHAQSCWPRCLQCGRPWGSLPSAPASPAPSVFHCLPG